MMPDKVDSLTKIVPIAGVETGIFEKVDTAAHIVARGKGRSIDNP